LIARVTGETPKQKRPVMPAVFLQCTPLRTAGRDPA